MIRNYNWEILIPSAIQNAISFSRVQIAIFSPRFADSAWCLDELVDMLKTKTLFIPVFFDVKLFDLRCPHKRVYATAFAKHAQKGRPNNEKIQQWKEAFQCSSVMSGYEFSTSNCNVEMMCTKIALAVLKEVGKTSKGFPRYGEVAEHSAVSTVRSTQVRKSFLLPRDSHPVGIDSKVEDRFSLLQDLHVPIIGVVGMGGSRKTRHFFSKKFTTKRNLGWIILFGSLFFNLILSRICIIAFQVGLIRENSEKSLWPSLFEEITAELIHEHLQGKIYLIGLDDMWTEGEILCKLGLSADKDCKVVVTTRNKEVGGNLKTCIYEMKNLSDEDSWKLFCIYTFPNCKENRAPLHLEERWVVRL